MERESECVTFMLSVSSLFRARNENIISNRDDVMNNGCFVRGREKRKEKQKSGLGFPGCYATEQGRNNHPNERPPLRWLLAIVIIAADP